MAVRFAGLALVASVALLAGCAPAFEMPAPLSDQAIQKRIDEGNAEWWNSMFPNEPQPYVEVIAYRAPYSVGEEITQCMRDAELPGVSIDDDGTITFSSDSGVDPNQVNRQTYVCYLEYPVDPKHSGYLSDGQIAWLSSYNENRLVPCLQLLGYSIVNRSGGYTSASGYWIQSFGMAPAPSREEWKRIDLTCPAAPIGPQFRRYSDVYG